MAFERPTLSEIIERVQADVESRMGKKAMRWSLASVLSRVIPENRGIYTQSDSSKKSSRNIWSLAVVSVDQRY